MAKVEITIRAEIRPQKYLESCTYEEMIELQAIVNSQYFKDLKNYKLGVIKKEEEAIT